MMARHRPVKADEATTDKARYLATLSDVSQSRVVEHAINESAIRRGPELRVCIERARAALAGSDAEIAAYLLDEG